ncbi:MAG: amidohydrolase family protein [Euzebya sp.]
MPRSKPRRLSRRHLLTASALAGAGGLLAACSRDGGTQALMDEELRLPALQRPPVALTNLVTPGSGQPLTLTLRGRRIDSVGPDLPDGVQAVDLDGGFLIPGFTDMHVHMQFADPAAILAGGVTTVRDLGGPDNAAQAIRGGPSGLRVLIAGRILTAVNGYPTQSWGADGTGRQITDPGDAVAAVEEQRAAGAVVLKVALEDSGGRPVLDAETLQVIVQQGQRFGLGTTAHVGSPAMLELALQAGVSELAHLPLFDVSAADMVAVAQAGIVVVPTLEIRGRDPGAAMALAAFRQAGGRVLYGTDLGNGGTNPGIESGEVRLLLEAGMTPQEILDSATSAPADYLQLDTGRLEPGRAADLVVLGSDPFADPAAYDDVRMVLANGELVGGDS